MDMWAHGLSHHVGGVETALDDVEKLSPAQRVDLLTIAPWIYEENEPGARIGSVTLIHPTGRFDRKGKRPGQMSPRHYSFGDKNYMTVFSRKVIRCRHR
jgi:hypothetical protein